MSLQIRTDQSARNTTVTMVQQLSRLHVLPECWRMFAAKAFWKQMCHVSSALVTWCGFPPGLGGSHGLDGAHNAVLVSWPWCADLSRPPPAARRPSRGSPCQKSAIERPTVKVVSCLKTLTISKRLEELAREVARVPGQPAGKEEDSETSHESFLDGDTTDFVRWLTI